MRQTTLRYSEPLLREAVRRFVVRALFRRMGVVFWLAFGSLVLDLAWQLWRHENDWMTGFLAATVFCAGTFIAALYTAHCRNTIGRFRKMRTPEAAFAYDQNNLCFTSELGSSKLPWSAVTEVWRFPRFWLLLFSRTQFVTLPLDCLDASDRQFITDKVSGSTSEPEPGT